MKLVSAVIKPFKLRGFGRTGGHIEIYRGKEYEFDFVDKLQVEIVTTDELADQVVDAVANAARTDTVGDGMLWVTDIEHVVRIRTNERGPAAL